MKIEICSLCKRESLAQIGVPLTEPKITESGKVIDTLNRKDVSMEVPIPLCTFHIPFLEDGLIYLEGKKLIFLGQLTLQNVEKDNLNDKQVRLLIKKYKKNPPDNEDYSIGIQSLKSLLRARKLTALTGQKMGGRNESK